MNKRRRTSLASLIKGFAGELSEEERFRDVNEYNVAKNMDLVRVHALFIRWWATGWPELHHCAGLRRILGFTYYTIGDFIALTAI